MAEHPHDWLSADVQRRARAGKQLPLLRAAGLHKWAEPARCRIVDATAGLGRESYLLAHAGADLLLIEREPATADDLAQRLTQARGIDALAEAAVRMRLQRADAIAWFRACQPNQFDVAYLDPMFADAHNSALAKKGMQALRTRTGGDQDAARLAEAALAAPIRRIVIKRAAKGHALLADKPTFTLGGNRVRFDVYDRPALAAAHARAAHPDPA